jgi:hypothetical protein
VKFETSRRKNALDSYASREYLREETLTTHKHSIGILYAKIEELIYKKVELEIGFPLSNDSHGFAKLDGFVAKKWNLIPNKLNLVWQLSGGLIRPMFGSKRVALNDRYFASSPFGYTHLGHCHPSNMPENEI